MMPYTFILEKNYKKVEEKSRIKFAKDFFMTFFKMINNPVNRIINLVTTNFAFEFG